MLKKLWDSLFGGQKREMTRLNLPSPPRSTEAKATAPPKHQVPDARGTNRPGDRNGSVEACGWSKPDIKAGVTYLYILQKSSAPSDYVLNQVLAFWKGQRGPNFAMLGGQKATSIPENADMYVMGILFAICDQYAFARQPDKLGYSTLTAGGEKIGVCRFIN
jgi:hypothetical protein